METYAHSFFTWALSKHGVKAGRAAGVAGAVGAVLPDIPAFVGTVYFAVKSGGFWVEEDLERIYFSGPFGATGSALHSVVPVAILLGLYWALRLGRSDRRRVFLWFLLGWFGHTIVDFLTHVDDLRPLFWPISSWMWASPISYYNPRYYGVQFMLVSHASMLAIMAVLLVRRLRRYRKTGPPKE
ncbi:MAG: hypothetical protein AVDCRST_MAG14-1062 [uncultured Rubrobacteraceae bacterium]|uniref:Metal-dependent hydrolase n=1 Tax=uncultured Rubrobacteraceae bacterium TaxID=349277 RepID=A0A6J4QQL3_9ACTN|nr:MAG: hypothetical protein AVDCRST_MAG14-1062 [uncultured Rubrobacteraceae bacterium]